MGVVNTLSTPLTDLAKAPPQLQKPQFVKGKTDESVAVVTKAAADSTNSTYRFHRVRSDAVIGYLGIACAAWGTSGAVDVGLYDTAENGGAVADVDMFCDGLDVSSALPSPTDITCHAQGPARYEQTVWERLGLSADPRKEYDVVVTAQNIGAAQAAATALILRTRQ
jgi:hypothetical protein